MQGTSLTKHERECKLYDVFDQFTRIKEETLYKYYLRLTQLINDMNIYNMKIEQFQVNTKFLNSLPPKWNKFVTDVKLVKDLHTTNFDQLHAYLEQHELHANEVLLLRERNQDPLVFVANQQMTPPHFNTYKSLYTNPQLQQYFVVPVFSPGDDLIACLNKAMDFLIVVASSRKCTQPKQTRNATWYKEKAMLTEAQEAGQILDEEQLTEDLDTYDFDYDDLSNAQAVLMANISNYGSDVISEVPHSETYLNDMENQGAHALQDFEQPPAIDF
ncbi:hypothetical protein Tco_1254389 [Tanacetum coccineum]